MNPSVAAVLQVLVQAKGISQVNSQLAGMNSQMAVTSTKSGAMGAAVKKGMMVGAAAIGAGGVALFKLGESFDDAYDTIRVGTGATGKRLEGLKGDFKAVVKSVPTDFKTASTAIADLNTRLGLTGKPLQERSKQFLELSRITKTDVSSNIKDVTRAFGDWEVKTKDQSGTLDKFFRAAQASGATVGELSQQVVKFGAPLRQVGFSLDEATAMFASFEKAGVNTATMMPGLKMALKSFMSEGIDPKAGLAATFKGIKDGSIDAAQAMKIFGTRAGPDMVEAVRQGRFDLDAMTRTLVNGSDTIMKAGKDTQDFGEKWQMIKNRVLVGLEPLAIRVFNAMGVAMDVLPPILSRIFNAVRTLLSPFTALTGAVADNKTAVVALGAASAVLLAAWAGFAIVAGVTRAIYAAVGAFWALNAAMAANPIGLVVIAIAALVAAFVVVYRESEVFRDIVNGAFKAVAAVAGWMWGAIQTVFNAIVSVIKWAWGQVLGDTAFTWANVKVVLAGAWEAIKSAASTAWNLIKTYIITPIRQVLEWLFPAIGNLVGFLGDRWGNIKDAASAAWNAIKQFIIEPIKGAVSGVRDAVGGVAGWLSDRWESVKSGAERGWGAVKTAIIKPVTDAVGWIREKIGDFVGIGGDIVRGIATGIKNAAGAVTGAIGDVVKGAISKAKGLLGIDSPSKVFAQFGANTAQGFALGITGQQAMVARAISGLTGGTPPPISASRSQSVAQPAGAPGSAAGGNVIVQGDLVVRNEQDARVTAEKLAFRLKYST